MPTGEYDPLCPYPPTLAQTIVMGVLDKWYPKLCEHCIYCISDGEEHCCICRVRLTPEERDRHRKILEERYE